MMIKIRESLKLMKNLSQTYIKRKFDVNYLKEIQMGLNMLHDPRNTFFREFGNENPDEVICLISLNPSWVPSAGFFALFIKVLGGLYYADRFHLTPVVDFWWKSPYEDPTITNTNVVFEYYFKPLSPITVKEALSSKNVVVTSESNCYLPLHDNNCHWFEPNDKYLSDLGRMVSKYVHFNDTTEKKLKNDIQMVLGGTKSLAIHYRGTDYNLVFDQHPKHIGVEEYYEIIDSAIDQHGFDWIFVATDDKKALDLLIQKYGKIIHYYDCYRDENGGTRGIHYSNSARDHHRSLLGYEVLRDAYTLSCCDGIIGGRSQVVTGAKIFKNSRNESFIFDYIMDKGLNRSSKTFQGYYEKNIKGDND